MGARFSTLRSSHSPASARFSSHVTIGLHPPSHTTNMEPVVLPKVHLRKIAKSVASEAALIAAVETFVRTVPGFAAFRLDIEFVRFVLKLVLNAIPTSKSRPLDAKTIVVSVLRSVWGIIKPEEIEMLSKMIDFLVTNKIVRRRPWIKRALYWLTDRALELPKNA